MKSFQLANSLEIFQPDDVISSRPNVRLNDTSPTKNAHIHGKETIATAESPSKSPTYSIYSMYVQCTKKHTLFALISSSRGTRFICLLR